MANQPSGEQGKPQPSQTHAPLGNPSGGTDEYRIPSYIEGELDQGNDKTEEGQETREMPSYKRDTPSDRTVPGAPTIYPPLDHPLPMPPEDAPKNPAGRAYHGVNPELLKKEPTGQ